MGKLKDLVQDGALLDYVEVLDGLMNKVDVPKEVATLFLRRLKEEIQHHVQMLKPQMIHETYNLAKLQQANCKAMGQLQGSLVVTPTAASSVTRNLLGRQPPGGNQLTSLASLAMQRCQSKEGRKG